MRKLPAIVALLAGLVPGRRGGSETSARFYLSTDQKYDFHTAEFDLDEVWMKSIDSLTAYSSRRITIGAIRDETFGLFSRGSVVTLVRCWTQWISGRGSCLPEVQVQGGRGLCLHG